MDMETSLLDTSSQEINAPILQPEVNSMDMRKPEKIRTRDGSGFRISDTLMGQNETKGNGLNDIERLYKKGRGMLLAKFYAMVRSCRSFIFNDVGMELEPFLIMTTVASSIYNVFKSCSNILYFRLLKTAELEEAVRRKIAEQRSKPVVDEMSLLLTHTEEKVWGEKRVGSKVAMIREIIGSLRRSTQAGIR